MRAMGEKLTQEEIRARLNMAKACENAMACRF